MSPTLHVTAGNQICHDDLKLKKHDQTLCCGACINCVDNKSPNAYMVKIRGIQNTDPVDCAHCDTIFNGDFVLPVYTVSKCNFIYETLLPSCYIDRDIALNLAPFLGDNQISVYIRANVTEQVLFIKSYGFGVPISDCIGVDINVPFNRSTVTKCDAETAPPTCHITAL